MTWTCYIDGCPIHGQPQQSRNPGRDWERHWTRMHGEVAAG